MDGGASDPDGEDALGGIFRRSHRVDNPNMKVMLSSAELYAEANQAAEDAELKSQLFEEMKCVSPAYLDTLGQTLREEHELDSDADSEDLFEQLAAIEFRPATPVYHTFDHAHAILHKRAHHGRVTTPPGRTSSAEAGGVAGIGINVNELANMKQSFLNQYVEASLKVLEAHDKAEERKYQEAMTSHPAALKPDKKGKRALGPAGFSLLTIDEQARAAARGARRRARLLLTHTHTARTPRSNTSW